MATIQLRAGMKPKGEYSSSASYEKLDVVCVKANYTIYICRQACTDIPVTNANYWEKCFDASELMDDILNVLEEGSIYTPQVGTVSTGNTSSVSIVNNEQTKKSVFNFVLEKGEKGDKGDKGDRGEKGDTTVIDPSTATAYTLYNQTGKHTDGAMTQAAVTEEFEKLDEVYARNDGYYETMGVGMATNLKGQNTVDAEFAYRKSGGNVEVQDGNAMIEAIKGNTIAWNQIYKNVRENTTVENVVYRQVNDYSFTYSGAPNKKDKVTQSIPVIIGHKYYFVCAQADDGIYLKNAYLEEKSGIAIASSSVLLFGVTFVPTKTYSTSVIYKPMLFDLTLIYGSGKEPSTPEQFEADYFNWFGKPLIYEPYDAGSLHNTKVSALKTTGFNLWDEEWEQGYIRRSDGLKVNNPNSIRSKNYCKCKPNTTYRLTCTKSGLTVAAVGVIFYNAEQQYIGGYWISNATIPTPANAVYFKITTQDSGSSGSTYGGTYNNDICLNISDVNRNGEYEPYKESTLPLDVTTLTGKLNGEGSSVVVFPNGMCRAGDAHDEIKIENGVVKAIKRVGKMDLGSLTWYGSTNGGWHSQGISNFIPKSPNAISVKGYAVYTNYNDFTNSVNNSIYFANDAVYIKDTTYSTAADFKAAMNGVMLYYELAEPEVYVLDDFNLPKLYPVANGGTEEQLSNSPNSLPATLSIRYGLNAAAFIQNAPKNYISKESMNNFLGNLGSAMGGTWSMVWNSSTNKYDFSFTQNRSVDVEQPIEDK